MFKYVVGAALTVIGAALELMMQVSAHDAAANACTYFAHYWSNCAHTLPDWFSANAFLLPAALIGLGLIILLWAPANAIKDRLSFERRFVPLRVAAASVYGELRGTDLGRFTEGHTGTPEEILDNVGMQILHNADIHVRRAPSPKWEIFPRSQIHKMGVRNGATGIGYRGDDSAYYTEPRVSRRALRRVTKQLKQNANFVSDWSNAPSPSPPSEAAAKEIATSTPDVLQLSVGMDHEYYDIPKGGLYSFTKRFKLKLENLSQHKAIVGGKVQILSIEPVCGYAGPWLLEDGITLAAGDHKFLPIAQYNELREPEKGMTPEDTFVLATVESKEHHKPLLGTDTLYTLTIRAMALDVPYRELKCKLCVNEKRRFQIEKSEK